MLRKANETKRQIIEHLNKRMLSEESEKGNENPYANFTNIYGRSTNDDDNLSVGSMKKLQGWDLNDERKDDSERVTYQVMIDKLNIGRELGEPNLSQMVDEVITDLTAYL